MIGSFPIFIWDIAGRQTDRQMPQLREIAAPPLPHSGDAEAPIAVDSSMQHGRSMNQLLYLLAFDQLVPSAALVRVDPNVAAQCQDTRDFYGCVRVFTTPAKRSNDIGPLAGVVERVAEGLISGPPPQQTTSFSLGMNLAGLAEGILQGVLR